MPDDAERRELERVAGRDAGWGTEDTVEATRVLRARRWPPARNRRTLMIVRNTAEAIAIRAALNACGSSSWNANLTME